MADQVNSSNFSSADPVLLAVRLGWLTVETFARLRRYARSGYQRHQNDHGDANRRFNFSDRYLSERGEYFFALEQLRQTIACFKPELPPCPLVTPDHVKDFLAANVDLDTCQDQIDNWSRQVWTTLSTENEKVGRGFTYGGSLADTYWHTDVLGPDHFAELLKSQRLEYLAARFDSIANHLPEHTAQILHYTLYKFRDDGQLAKLEPGVKKRALKLLESQAKVWHDLLFGSRSADSYLWNTDRRWIMLGGLGITLVFALVVIFGVWLTALTMSSAGRAVTAGMTGLSQEIGAQSAFIGDLLDWQKWSTLLATLSSMVVLFTGLVSNVSGWLIGFYRRVKAWLNLQFIYHRTYRR